MSEPGSIGPRLPHATNYRGKRVGAWLGITLAGVLLAVIGGCVVSALLIDGHLGSFERRLLWMAAGIGLVFGAGLYDDYRPARTRGLVRQVRLLATGRITSGIVKLVVIVLASAIVAWMLGARGSRFALAVPVVAASANLWNLFDVVPGRALKGFVLADLVLLFTVEDPASRLLAGTALAAGIVALGLDLREVAMLGDSGSNVLGFIVGIGLLGELSVAGLAVALSVLLALHVLAETITLSKAISATAPLRWFDQLGRIRSETPGNESDRRDS